MKSANPGVPWLSGDVVEISGDFVSSLLLPRGLEECADPAADAAEPEVDGVAVQVVEE